MAAAFDYFISKGHKKNTNIYSNFSFWQAMWFTTEQGLDGPVYGAADQWNGVGVFFDSFDNDGKVSMYFTFGRIVKPCWNF